MDFYATKTSRSTVKYHSGGISFVGYIITVILVKNWKILTLIILGKMAMLYTKSISCYIYPLLGSNTARGG